MQILFRDVKNSVCDALKSYEEKLGQDDGWERFGPPDQVARVLAEFKTLKRSKAIIDIGQKMALSMNNTQQQAFYTQSMQTYHTHLESQNKEKQKIIADLHTNLESTKSKLADTLAAGAVGAVGAAAMIDITLASVGGSAH